MQYSIRGRQYAVDIFDGDFDTLNDGNYLYSLLMEAAIKCGAIPLEGTVRQFEPQGATVYIVLSESHISCHSYPEKGFIAVDCYTCGDNADPKIAIEYVIKKLQSTDYEIKFVPRGR